MLEKCFCACHEPVTQVLLKKLYDYDPSTGSLHHKTSNGRTHIGDKVGCPIPNGYLVTTIKRKNWRVHRLIWIWHHGAIPKNYLVDHIDGDPTNNHIENLRLATPTQNMLNKRHPRGEYFGVSFIKKLNRYRVRVTTPDGTLILLGSAFKTEQEAQTAKLAYLKQTNHPWYNLEGLKQKGAADVH